MTEITEQAQAAKELFEELLNGAEAGRAHHEMPAGALLFGRVSKRVCGKDRKDRDIVFWQAWPHFKDMSVADLHTEFMRLQDMPRGEVLAYMKSVSEES